MKTGQLKQLQQDRKPGIAEWIDFDNTICTP